MRQGQVLSRSLANVSVSEFDSIVITILTMIMTPRTGPPEASSFRSALQMIRTSKIAEEVFVQIVAVVPKLRADILYNYHVCYEASSARCVGCAVVDYCDDVYDPRDTWLEILENTTLMQSVDYRDAEWDVLE